MRSTKRLLIATLVLYAGLGPAAAQTASISASEAESVVLHYLDALSQGDTVTIKQLLGGEHLKSSRAMLDNPSYPEMLSNIYGAAVYNVVNTYQKNADSTVVDTVIRLSPDESLAPRFILKYSEGEGLKIVDEENPDTVLD